MKKRKNHLEKLSLGHFLKSSEIWRAMANGATRLDGAWGEKQVWRPHVRIWGLSEANALHWRKYLWHCWEFSTRPTVIWRPHSDSAPKELCPPCYPSLRPWPWRQLRHETFASNKHSLWSKLSKSSNFFLSAGYFFPFFWASCYYPLLGH